MLDFAMCYEETKGVFEIARGFLAVVIMDICMLQAGWGLIEDGEHGTLHTATAGAVFFVFDVGASDWAEMLLELAQSVVIPHRWLRSGG
jgi:hypothetical protein